MMNRFALTLLLLMPSPLVLADTEPMTVERLRSANPDLTIEWARPFQPIPGLYEVKIGGKLYYMDESGTYLFSGHVFHTPSKADLTAARLEEINRIDWQKLPLDQAIVSGDAYGLEVAIFTDPDCPYCRKLENVLRQTKGVKVYTFLYPIEQLHPQAKAKSEAIWCAEDRQRAMHEVMLENKNLGKAVCATPVNELIALGQQLGIHATPTLIARDGRLHAGFMPADQLKAWLGRR